MRVTQQIAAVLAARRANHPGPDLLDRWHEGMETQVNVVPGEPVEDKRSTYTADGMEYWNIRIPKGADSEPTWNDYELRWPLGKFVAAIGSTGWNWRDRRSCWVGFDYDSITGHAAGIGVTGEALDAVREAATLLPYVEVRKSTRGGGLHLYVHVDVPTANHTEHAALARVVLGMMSSETGFDFASQVDTCGGNMWIWHRECAGGGFSLVKPAAKTLTAADLPANWRDHIAVVKGRRHKVSIPGVEDHPLDLLTRSRRHVPLDAEHKRVLDALAGSGYTAVWISDHHLVQTHTRGLKEVHGQLGLKGVFDTNSQGTDRGTPNCFMFPVKGGGWRVYRFSLGVGEAASWRQDGAGWTTCTFNQLPSWEEAARAVGGAESPKGGYVFAQASQAAAAAAAAGCPVDLPVILAARDAILRQHVDGNLVLELSNPGGDIVPGWDHRTKKKYLTRIIGTPAVTERDTAYDHAIRVLVTPNGEQAGTFVLGSAGRWDQFTTSLAKDWLEYKGVPKGQLNRILGSAADTCWQQVWLPFQPEFPGNRQWNRGAPQLRCLPAETPGPHPHWDMILDHVGQSLAPDLPATFATPADYLRAWLACVIRKPFDPLPYLFLFGPENSGKSILWEAFELLVTRGVEKAARALKNRSDFNGELAGAILCVVEEEDISRVSGALDKLKDFVTSPILSIRRMRTDAYSQLNTTHWIQTANKATACPIMPGDTRIVMMYVPRPSSDIPKAELLGRCRNEAPNFLRTLLDLELPEPQGRLRLPVIETKFKRSAQLDNRDPVQFLIDHCVATAGAEIPLRDFYEKFVDDSPEVEDKWPQQTVTKALKAAHCATRKGGGGKLFLLGYEWKTPSDEQSLSTSA